MGWLDKIANRVQILRGKGKEVAGKISNSPGLAVDGKFEQGRGHFKQSGEKIKDAVRSMFKP
jgi:uncharacterized protein YjbJ (UPF0337 family)